MVGENTTECRRATAVQATYENQSTRVYKVQPASTLTQSNSPEK